MTDFQKNADSLDLSDVSFTESFPVTCTGNPSDLYPNFKSEKVLTESQTTTQNDNENYKKFNSLSEALNMEMAGSKLVTADYVVLLIYFLIVLAVGLWSMHQNKSRGTIKGYFLANKSMVWYTVGASLFASNIGSTHFIGLAGAGASGGWAAIAYEFNGMLVVLALSYLFLPVYMSCNAKTMPEYLKLRFGRSRLNFIISLISLVIYIFTKISADLYAGAIFIQQAMHMVNIWQPIIILLCITAVFTIGGGLSAVIYTDTVQAVIMIGGGIYVAVAAFQELPGGYSSLRSQYLEAGDACWSDQLQNSVNASGHQIKTWLEQCEAPSPNAFKIFRPITDDDFPWLGILTGMTINSVWYWCSDQVIVQRVLSAKHILHAKMATIFCSLLKVSVIFIMVMPGMISRILFPYTVGCTDQKVCKEFCNLDRCNDVAYPHLVVRLLPAGLIGLMVAVMMSSLLSSLTSIFNSASSIFTIDVWPKMRKAASEKELMIVSRIFVFILILISVCWIPIVEKNQTGSLFVYVQMVSSYFQPPICAVYVMGLFMPTINEVGAFYGLMSGLTLGIIRMGLDMAIRKPGCLDKILGQQDLRINYVQKGFPFLTFALFIFLVTLFVGIVVSRYTREIDYRPPARTYWQDRVKPIYKSGEEMSIKKTEPSMAILLEKTSPVKETSSESLESFEETSSFRRLVNFLCGFSEGDSEEDDKNNGSNNNVNNREKAYSSTSWQPVIDRKWDRVVDVSAVICCFICIFMWIWFDRSFVGKHVEMRN